ncbi:MAG TPA: hypothetical protein DIU49_07905 [Desulfovibrio sp.]|nr:hypothetical protein [Desulfovibrio sp.]
MEMDMEIEMERKMPPAAGGDHPPRTPCMGSPERVGMWSFAGVRRRGRNLAGDAVAALQARRPNSGLAGPSPLRGESEGIFF